MNSEKINKKMKGWSRKQKRHWIILCLQQSGRMQLGRIRGWAHTGVWKYQRWLTNEVGQQKQEHYRDEDGTEGSTFPVAVLVGLLQAEGRTGESIPRQRAWGWRVHCARGQRVTWRRCAIHWWCSTWFEQELPGKKNLVAVRNSHKSEMFVLITVKSSSQYEIFPSTGKYWKHIVLSPQSHLS